MNIVWIILLFISIIMSLFGNKIDEINNIITNVGIDTLNMVFSLIVMSAFFNGWLKIAEKIGIVELFKRLLMPIFKIIFPELINEKTALDLLTCNLTMNMLGMGSAASISGLNLMKELARLNNYSNIASKSMRSFIILNCAGITLFQSTVVALRLKYNSQDPFSYMPLTIIISLFTSIFVMIIDYNLKKKY